MENVAQLRERAAQLLALALRAHEHGQATVADELTEMALKNLTHAEVINGRYTDQLRVVVGIMPVPTT